jgi:hypothetical protein
MRLGIGWLSRAAWTIGRTGRPGLIGIALLLAAALFLFSTLLRVASDVETLRSSLAAAQQPGPPAPADMAPDPAGISLSLPPRTDVPEILRRVFQEARRARVTVDSGKYEVDATRGSVVRYQIAFPVNGYYPDIRAFIDATLATIPAVALSDLAFERRAISDGDVQAQIRLTVYASATAPVELPGAAGPAAIAGQEGPPIPSSVCSVLASDRVVVPTRAGALFAQHSWYVIPPAPAPLPPPPPAQATAPPFPFTFLGSYAPTGEPPVFFLARGDRVIDAHVGDRIDGVYQFESAGNGQLVFVYLPLDIRQNLPAGGTP